MPSVICSRMEFKKDHKGAIIHHWHLLVFGVLNKTLRVMCL